VDVQLDIGPAFYNFIDIRYIGEPVLRERIFASDQNVTYITKTVNVTNITYTNSTVYNYGPDYNALSRFSTRPIQRLTLQRETNVDPIAAVRSNSLMKVHGDKLVIAAPAQLQKPPKPVAPKVVKEKIAQTPLERGWEPVGDPKAQAELKQKLKAEDPKTVLPPSFKPRDDAGQSPASSPAITANVPAAEASPASPETVTAPATLATSPGSSPSLSPPGKLRDAREEKPGPSVVPSPSPAPAASPVEKSKTERGNKPAATVPPSSTAPAATPRPKRNPPSEDRERTSPPVTRSTEGDQPIAPPSRDNGARKEKPPEKSPDQAPALPPQPNDASANKRKSKAEAPPAPINREVQPDRGVKRPMPPGPAEQPKREAPADIPQKRPPQERVAPPTGPVPNAPERPDGPRKGPDKNKPQSSPSPGQ
jgi:hypothetical protein